MSPQTQLQHPNTEICSDPAPIMRAFIDIPDPDNFFMVLQAARDILERPAKSGKSGEAVLKVVLSRRPVSLDVPRCDSKHWAEFRNACGGERLLEVQRNFDSVKDNEASGALALANKDATLKMLKPLPRTIDWARPAWVSALPPHMQPFFSYPDDDASSNGHTPSSTKRLIEEDSDIYIRLSALRLIDFLDSHNIPRECYRLYSDPTSLGKINVTIRHCQHKEDHTFGFNKLEIEDYKTAYAEYHKEHIWATEADHVGQMERPKLKGDPSPELRIRLRAVCEKYIQRMTWQLGIKNSENYLYGFDSMIDEDLATAPAFATSRILVGGPFTEAFEYVKKVSGRHNIYGMGGSIYADGRSNLLDNPFNFQVDLCSAADLANLASQKESTVRLYLLPTECGKDRYTVLQEEAKLSLEKISPQAGLLLDQYHEGKFPYPVFDYFEMAF
ncbi:hypothetical protein DL764_006025 [Monosporascus ibericus]|uniref:Uncharacterized protein n=1 Tax=Monosporascus ibericus TaxID=155417 RepID=A0A4Q4T9C2_9PEZI|nr:hypothetical protein DL764_006025 [Monosporascus ibericus]